jgi:hypothetical protein
MNRRGFLRLLAGSAAAVGAVCTTSPDASTTVTAPVAQPSPSEATITLPEGHSFTGMTLLGPWNSMQPYTLHVAGPHEHTIKIANDTFPDYDENFRLARERFLEDRAGLSMSRPGFAWTRTIKPSADFIDW